jgi:hypothetical protein
MATKHFSLPDKVLAWLDHEAGKRGMKISPFLTHLLVKLMEEQNNNKGGHHEAD